MIFKNGRLSMIGLSVTSNKYLSLIVVPISLRRTVFVALYISGVGAHMGDTKHW